MKIAFIGGGNMASALIGGLIQQGTARDKIYAVDMDEAARLRLTKHFQIATDATLSSTLKEYEVIVLAVKPHVLPQVAHELAVHLQDQLVISIAAGARLADLARWLEGYTRLVRAMPNTPALVGAGVTGVFTDDSSATTHALVEQVFTATGSLVWCETEKQVDAISAISGSGPAYVFYFIEALAAAAHQLGFSETESETLALQTFAGAVQLAQQANEPPSQLRKRVTSQGGTTAAALASFEHDQIKSAIIQGALAAHKRAQEMAEELGQH